MNVAKLFGLKKPRVTAERRGFATIRYRSPDEVCHGIIIEELPKGALKIWLVGDDRARILKAPDARYVTRLDDTDRQARAWREKLAEAAEARP